MAVQTTMQLAEAYRVGQAQVAARAATEMTVAFRTLLDPSALDRTFPVYQAAAVRILDQARHDTAAMGGAFYLAHRKASQVLGAIPEIAWAPDMPLAQAVTSLLVTGPIAVKKALSQGATVEQALGTAMVQTQGMAYRHAANGGRQTIMGTIHNDRRALGWARVTDGRPCYFCAMLASRGAIYKSSSSALLKADGEKYHDHCGCYCVPVYDRDDPIPGIGDEMKQLWKDNTKGLKGDDAINAFRAAYDLRYPPGSDPSANLAKAQLAKMRKEAAENAAKLLAPPLKFSDELLAKIDAAVAEMPKTRAEWRESVVKEIIPAGRRVDQEVARYKTLLEKAKERVATVDERMTAEFKRKRTPHAKRDRLLRLERIDSEGLLMTYERLLADFEAKAAADPSTLDYYLTRLEPAVTESLYPKDPNGVNLPPADYEKHLDTALALGKALREETVAAFATDARMQTLQAQKAEADAALVKARQGFGPIMTEQVAAQEARRAVHVREAEIVRAMLAQARPSGAVQQPMTVGDPLVLRRIDFTKAETQPAPSDWEALMREGESIYPDDWRRLSANAGDLHVIGSDRAYQMTGNDATGRPDFIALDGWEKSSYDGAYSGYRAEVAAHELGHRMEAHVPGLRELEFTFVRRRATHDGIVEKTVQIYAGNSREISYKDEWKNAYAGKTYERHDPAASSWEVFQVGTQDTFGRATEGRFGDDELQEFVLAVMMLLGRS